MFLKICSRNILEKKVFWNSFSKGIKYFFPKLMGAGSNLLGCRKKQLLTLDAIRIILYVSFNKTHHIIKVRTLIFMQNERHAS